MIYRSNKIHFILPVMLKLKKKTITLSYLSPIVLKALKTTHFPLFPKFCLELERNRVLVSERTFTVIFVFPLQGVLLG